MYGQSKSDHWDGSRRGQKRQADNNLERYGRPPAKASMSASGVPEPCYLEVLLLDPAAEIIAVQDFAASREIAVTCKRAFEALKGMLSRRLAFFKMGDLTTNVYWPVDTWNCLLKPDFCPLGRPPLGDVPDRVKSLRLIHALESDGAVTIPDHITDLHIYFRGNTSRQQMRLPLGLVRLRAENYPGDLPELPATLRYLWVSGEYGGRTDHLPQGLEGLSLERSEGRAIRFGGLPPWTTYRKCYVVREHLRDRSGRLAPEWREFFHDIMRYHL